MENNNAVFKRDIQYYKFCGYGFLKNLQFFEPFLILFYLEKGLTFLQIGTLYTIGEITINVLEIPTGILADALGRRRTLIYSFIFYIVSFGIFYVSRSYWFFVIASLFFGVGEGFRTGTHKAMIFEYLKLKGWTNQKVFYYGHTRAWSQVGSAISALIAAGIVFYTGKYAYIFLYSVIPYLLDLILVSSYPKALDGILIKFNIRTLTQSIKSVIAEFFIGFTRKSVFKAITNLASFSGYFKAIKDYLQPVLKTLAMSLPFFAAYAEKQRAALVVGIVYFIIYLLTSISSAVSGRFSRRFLNLMIPLNITMYFGFFIGLWSGLFFLWGITGISIFLFLLLNLIENIRKPIGYAYITDLLDQNILATVLSVESQAISLFAAIIAPIIGFIADKWGVGMALIVVSISMLVMAPIFSVSTKNK